MKHPNEALFEQTLYQISDPKHERYGKHMKRDELKEMLRPSSEATDAVLEWLSGAGLDEKGVTADGEWINIVTTLEIAETLLVTVSTSTITLRPTRKRFVRCPTAYRTLFMSTSSWFSLPHASVDSSAPFPRIIISSRPSTNGGLVGQMRPQGSRVFETEIIGKARGKLGGADAGGFNATACNATITPTCLLELYNVKGFHVVSLLLIQQA